MPADPAAAPSTRARVHTFVDFWNYDILMRDVDGAFRTDWRRFPTVLAEKAMAEVEPGAPHEYRGMNVYMSYDDRGTRNAPLRRWATGVRSSSA